MTDDDITRLRELAQAATADDLLRMVVQVDTILALLSRLESAERERDEARADMHAAWKSAHDNAAKFVDAEAERDALAADAACFRFWVSEAARSPSAMAALIANCTTEDEYRAAILPIVESAKRATEAFAAKEKK